MRHGTTPLASLLFSPNNLRHVSSTGSNAFVRAGPGIADESERRGRERERVTRGVRQAPRLSLYSFITRLTLNVIDCKCHQARRARRRRVVYTFGVNKV